MKTQVFFTNAIVIFFVFLAIFSGCHNIQEKNQKPPISFSSENESLPDIEEITENNNGEANVSSLNKSAADSLTESNSITGYWASFFTGYDDITHLDGLYLAEDGTGLMFHSAEGGFLISSYTYSDSILTIWFLNMGDELVEWIFQVPSLSDNELITMAGEDGIMKYERVLMIEPYNSMGSYTVTQMDGSVIDIMGYY